MIKNTLMAALMAATAMVAVPAGGQNAPTPQPVPSPPEQSAEQRLEHISTVLQALNRAHESAAQRCDREEMERIRAEAERFASEGRQIITRSRLAGAFSSVNPEVIRRADVQMLLAISAINTHEPTNCPPEGAQPPIIDEPPLESILDEIDEAETLQTPPTPAPVPSPPEPTATERLNQIAHETDRLKEQHDLAVKRCDRSEMERIRAEAARLASEGRSIINASRLAGAFSAVDPDLVQRAEHHIDVRLREINERQPTNCPTEGAQPPQAVVPAPTVQPAERVLNGTVPSATPAPNLDGDTSLRGWTPGETEAINAAIHGGDPLERATPGLGLRLWYGEQHLPAPGIGFFRDGPSGTAPEQTAGSAPRPISLFGIVIEAAPADHVRIHGFVTNTIGNNRNIFDVTAASGVTSGSVYGDLSPGGSSGIATPFGLSGEASSDLTIFGFGGSYDVLSSRLGGAGGDGSTVELDIYTQYEHRDRDYFASIAGSGTSGSSTFSFGQDRAQSLNEDMFEVGLDGRITFSLGDGFTAKLRVAEGVYRQESELRSTEHNVANFGPSVDRDFTIAIDDDDGGWGLHSLGEASLLYSITPSLGVIFGGAVDHRTNVGSVFNPNSGDQVFFDGLSTTLNSDDAWSWNVFFGLRFRL